MVQETRRLLLAEVLVATRQYQYLAVYQREAVLVEMVAVVDIIIEH